MAYDLLLSIGHGLTVEHQICHDVESFIWVIFYGMLRRIAFIKRPIKELAITEETIKHSTETFNTLFNCVGIAGIRSQRYFTPPWYRRAQGLPPFLNDFLLSLDNYIVITLRGYPKSSKVSTSSSQAKHADLVRFLDSAVTSIRQQVQGAA